MTDIFLFFQQKLGSYGRIELFFLLWSVSISLLVLSERIIFYFIKKNKIKNLLILKISVKSIVFSIMSSYIIFFYWIITLFKPDLTAFFLFIFYSVTGYMYNKYVLKLLSTAILGIFIVSYVIRSIIL